MEYQSYVNERQSDFWGFLCLGKPKLGFITTQIGDHTGHLMGVKAKRYFSACFQSLTWTSSVTSQADMDNPQPPNLATEMSAFCAHSISGLPIVCSEGMTGSPKAK